MLRIRHYWDAANLHNHATVCCGLIRSHKLSQVSLGQSFEKDFSFREASKKCSGVTGRDVIDSSGSTLLSGFCASTSWGVVWWPCMSEWPWPLSSHWGPPTLVFKWGLNGSTCLYQLVQLTQPERSQKASLNFVSKINWIHCWFLHPYPEFHVIILSCYVSRYLAAGSRWKLTPYFGFK